MRNIALNIANVNTALGTITLAYFGSPSVTKKVVTTSTRDSKLKKSLLTKLESLSIKKFHRASLTVRP